MPALQVALRDVVGHAIAEHMVHRVGLRNAASGLADYHYDFGFVIPFGGELGIERDVVVRADNHIGGLREERRCIGLWHILAFALTFALIEMIPVVPTCAQHVAAKAANRSEQPHCRKVEGLSGEIGRSALHNVER